MTSFNFIFMYRLYKYISVALLLLFSAAFLTAENLPTTTVNGKKYYYYDVKPSETIYSISQRLGISRDDIIKYNPTVSDGLKAYTTLYFPVDEITPVQGEYNGSTIEHKVKKNETIYGLSKQYNTTTEAIIALNPSARDGIKKGDKLIIPVSEDNAKASTKKTTKSTNKNTADFYAVQKGDSFYGIARNHDMSVEELAALNADVNPTEIREGQLLRIREDAPEVISQHPGSDYVLHVNPPVTFAPVDSTVALEESATVRESKPLSIVLMLPFMLNEEKQSKQTQLLTDFYKGFLIAADTLSHVGAPVKITALDTEGSLARVNTLLLRDDVKNASVILGPEDETQLAAIANHSKEYGTYVFNIFNIKDESYAANPFMIQGNIDRLSMYKKAIEALSKRFSDYTLVILQRTNGKNEKAEFVSEVKKAYDLLGKKYIEINYSETLRQADLSSLSTDGKYVFLPNSGTSAEFGKFEHAVRVFKDKNLLPDNVQLFGYPDWSAFRGDRLEQLHRINTTIFSRFYDETGDYRSRNLTDAFTRWYGTPMMDVVPKQGLLGFDVGTFLIRALRLSNGDFSPTSTTVNGVQSSFSFARNDADATQGFVNRNIYIVNFRPENIIYKEIE